MSRQYRVLCSLALLGAALVTIDHEFNTKITNSTRRHEVSKTHEEDQTSCSHAGPRPA